MKTQLILSTSVVALMTLSGCQEYLHRSDFINPHSGDAVARNASIQTVDPWPRYVNDTDIHTNGKRQADAVKRYEDANEEKPAAPAAMLLQPAPAPSSGGN